VGNGKQAELLDGATGHLLHILTTDDGAKSLTFSPDGRILGIAGNSGNEELWDVASGSKLVTLVNLVGVLGGESKEWLVVTPDGLFDGSPAAWAHILWRFSGRTFDVTPVELFFNEYYYPGLLADILHGQRPRASQDISTKDRRQPHLTLTGADGISSTSSVSTRAVKVVLSVANAPAGARDLRLFRNGSLVKVWHGDVLKGAENVSLEATVPIVAGENKLTAYAFNQDNIKSQDAVLTIEGAESLQRPAVLYVVTVGINAYADPQFNLKYAAADAQVFADEVKRQQIKVGRFSRVEVANLSDQDATKANILLALKALSGGGAGASTGSFPAALRNLAPAQPEDGVILFYAGHGTAQESRFYLIPHDLGYSGQRGNLNEQGAQTILQHSISDQEMEEALEEVDAGQALLVIDACNSGQALEAEEKRRGPMNSKGLAQLAYEKGMNILTASQSYQAALEASRLGHGYLTYALVEEGLKTDAADIAPKDGQVEVREWLDYATSRVPQMQEIKIQETRAQGRELAFVARAERSDDAEKQEVQRPRAFYRRELQQQPFIIARSQK
jgi:Caspase domain